MKYQDLLKAANKFGTPCYVYDASKIKKQYDRLINSFKTVKNLKINYAVKALSNLGDLKNQKISKTKKKRILKKFRYYISIIEKDLTENTKYPKAINLLETINQNIKIQTQSMIKIKKIE